MVVADTTLYAKWTKNSTGGGSSSSGGSHSGSSGHSGGSSGGSGGGSSSNKTSEKSKEELAKEKAEQEKLAKEKQSIAQLNKELQKQYPNNLVCNGKVFLDVQKTAWYYDVIQSIIEKELMTGVSENKFEPEANTTRAMLITVLHRMSKDESKLDAKDELFTDVKHGTWYYDAVLWGQAKNIIAGYDDKSFGVNDNITREQLVSILYRYAQYKNYDMTARADLDKYTDASDLASYALTPMQWAVQNGLIKGTTDTSLAVKKEATRAEIATILINFIKRFEE